MMRFVRGGDQLHVRRERETMPLLTQQAAPGQRPFVHPLRAPDGHGVLTENEPPHHPWQHGLYTGLNDVNGVGFWTEGKLDQMRATDGNFHPRAIETGILHGECARWRVVCDWRDPRGSIMLTEAQQWSLADRGDTYQLTLEWTLTALRDLTFGHYDYGGLFLRMPYRHEGEAINSDGLTGVRAEGQPARWCAVSMPIDGREDWAGVALFDHPSNFRYPAPWRVDNQLGIVSSPCIAGAWSLAENQTARFRYAVLAFCGRADLVQIESHWQRFSQDNNA